MTVSFNHAASAYKDATRVAERIVSDMSDNTAKALPTDSTEKTSFHDLVAGSLQESRDVGYNSEITSTKAIAKEAELHDLITAVSNAELTLNTIVATRDRMINAYQDIIKMPI